MQSDFQASTLLVRSIPALLAMVFSSTVGASAFQLLEQTGTGVGMAFAGSAVSAEDASTVYFNPAGMSLLPQGKKSLSLGLDLVKPTVKFSNNASISSCQVPASATSCAMTHSLNGNGSDAGGLAFIPNGYFAMHLNESVSFGVGIGAPFGLKTEYDSDWAGRFQAVKSEVKTMNLNPSLSFKLNEKILLGVGLNYQKIDATFSSAANYSLLIASAASSMAQAASAAAAAGNAALAGQLAAQATALRGKVTPPNVVPEGFVSISGSDTSWGYNLGAIFQVSPETRIGLSYRSPIRYHVTGNASSTRTGDPVVDAVVGSSASPARGGAVYCDIKLPDTFTFSALQRLSEKWDLLGDLSWTGWAKIPVLEFRYSDGSMLSSTQENWRNTWRIALGGIYKYNENWKVRMGLAYDQSPVGNEYRTARLPDNDRTWLSLGVQYKPNRDSAIDIGYSHVFVKNGPINHNGGSASGQMQQGLLNGNYNNSVDILGIQYSISF